jgi:plasmid stabilization system protein ParE
VTLIAAFHAVAPRSSVVPTPEVRQRVVTGFPFVIAYRDLGAVVRIDAVAHTRREPGYSARRIR